MFIHNTVHIFEYIFCWNFSGTLDIFSARDKAKSYNMKQLIAMQTELDDHIESELVPAGIKIHQLADHSFKAVGISKVSWLFFLS